MSKGIS